MADLTPRQYRLLRDMADGHLNLYATVRSFDPTTGGRIDPPELLHIGHDRPDIADPDWWKPLLADGLIALPAANSARCAVTLDGHKAVAAYRTKETDHG